MSDPLAPFRRNTPPAAPAASPAPPRLVSNEQQPEYVAFEARDRVTRLQVRSTMNPWRSPVYTSLLDVSYDGGYGLNFVLVYGFMYVLVRGRNLQPVVAAILDGRAHFIQQFDPDLFARPTDATAPVIESIELEFPGEAKQPAATGKPPVNVH